MTDNDLQCILNHVKVKSVTQLKPLAGRVPVKRKRFADFIKCLINGFRNVPEAYFFEKLNSIPPKKAFQPSKKRFLRKIAHPATFLVTGHFYKFVIQTPKVEESRIKLLRRLTAPRNDMGAECSRNACNSIAEANLSCALRNDKFLSSLVCSEAFFRLTYQHHREHHDEQRDRFANAEHHEVVHEALAGFAKSIASVSRGFTHVPGASHHADTTEDAYAEVSSPVPRSRLRLVQNEHHQKHAVNRLRNRRAHEDEQRKERVLTLKIRFFPGTDGRHAGSPATQRRTHCSKAKGRHRTELCERQKLCLIHTCNLTGLMKENTSTNKATVSTIPRTIK